METKACSGLDVRKDSIYGNRIDIENTICIITCIFSKSIIRKKYYPVSMYYLKFVKESRCSMPLKKS